MNKEVEALIRKEMGDTAAKAVADVLNNPQLAPYILTNFNGGELDLQLALKQIGDYCAGQGDLAQAVGPFRTLAQALTRRAQLKPVSRKATIERSASTEGLAEAMDDAVALKEAFGILFSGFELNVPVAKKDRQDLTTLLALEEATFSLYRSVMFGRVAVANRCAETLRTGFTPLRDLAVAKVPEARWAALQHYLFGAAEEAAARAKENQARDALTEARVTEAVREEATREAKALYSKVRKARTTDDGDDDEE